MPDTAQLPVETTAPPYHKLRAIEGIDQMILQRIGEGKSLYAIATEFNVTDAAILRRAQKHPSYRDELAVGVELRMDKREQELECAGDNVSVTRADRLLGHARWIAERTVPERYGQKNQLHVSGTLTLDTLLGSCEPDAIEGECAAQQDGVEQQLK